MALKPENPVVGGTVLRRAAIQSPNFVTGVSGWTINQDGSAEFNNLLLRGTFTGTDYIINSAGEFFYSGTPAAGNLIASITNSAGTDGFGNTYLTGTTNYTNVGPGSVMEALQISGFTIISYTAPNASGAYTARQQIAFDTNTSTSIYDVALGGVAGGRLAANSPWSTALIAVQPGTTATAETWHSASFVNSWTGSGSATNGLFYRLTPENEVRLIGDLSSPGTATLITTLPAGYRPQTGVNVEFNRYDDSGTAHALVGTDGTVTMQTVVGAGKGLFCNASIPLDSL